MCANSHPVVVICGSIHRDTVVCVPELPQVGETAVAVEATRALGGKGANQAVAAAINGAEAIMAGTVGEDSAADFVLEQLQANGVNTHSIHTSWEQPTGYAFVARGKESHPVIYVQRGAGSLTDPGDYAEEIRRADVVLSQGELTAEIARGTELAEAIAIASCAGAEAVKAVGATSALEDRATPVALSQSDAFPKRQLYSKVH